MWLPRLHSFVLVIKLFCGPRRRSYEKQRVGRVRQSGDARPVSASPEGLWQRRVGAEERYAHP